MTDAPAALWSDARSWVGRVHAAARDGASAEGAALARTLAAARDGLAAAPAGVLRQLRTLDVLVMHQLRSIEQPLQDAVASEQRAAGAARAALERSTRAAAAGARALVEIDAVRHDIADLLNSTLHGFTAAQEAIPPGQLAAAAARSLAFAGVDTWRGAAARLLRRDRLRTLVDRDAAGWLAARLVGAAAEASERTLVASARDVDNDLAAIGHRLADLHGLLSGVPAVPSLPRWNFGSAGGWLGPPGAMLTGAARHSVQPLRDRPEGGLWLRTPHSYGADLATIWGRRGYAVDRERILVCCATAWSQWLSDSQRAVRRRVDDVQDLTVTPYLGACDRAVQAWIDASHAAETAARAALTRAEHAIGAWEAIAADRTDLAKAWSALHAPDDGGLSVAVRSALPEVTAQLDTSGQAELERLAARAPRPPEIRVAVVAAMKAGKSTLLSALLGQDLAPRRAQAMTVLATRLVLGAATPSGEPELLLTPTLIADATDLAHRLVARLSTPPAPALAGQPHLARFAAELHPRMFSTGPAIAGAEAVRLHLAALNELARLAMQLLPADRTAQLVDSVPEVRVPGPGGGRVVLVDTPGPNEALGGRLLEDIAVRQVGAAHGCVVVVDYTQIGSVAEARLAARIPAAAGPGRRRSAVGGGQPDRPTQDGRRPRPVRDGGIRPGPAASPGCARHRDVRGSGRRRDGIPSQPRRGRRGRRSPQARRPVRRGRRPAPVRRRAGPTGPAGPRPFGRRVAPGGGRHRTHDPAGSRPPAGGRGPARPVPRRTRRSHLGDGKDQQWHQSTMMFDG